MQNTIDFYTTNRLYYYRRQNTQNIYSLITLRSGATFGLHQPDNERKKKLLALLVISQLRTKNYCTRKEYNFMSHAP